MTGGGLATLGEIERGYRGRLLSRESRDERCEITDWNLDDAQIFLSVFSMS